MSRKKSITGRIIYYNEFSATIYDVKMNFVNFNYLDNKGVINS